MNVLFVQNIEGIAGSEKYFWHLLPSLKKAGLDVSFLCVFKPGFAAVANQFCEGLTRENIPVYKIETRSYLSWSLLRKMKTLVTENKVDILHSHLIYADFWSACLKSFFKVKILTVSTLHGYQEDIYTRFCLQPERVPKNRYYRVARFAYKRIDYVYSCSEGLKNFFLRAGIAFKNPVEVIHHGFDYPAVEPVQRGAESFVCAIPGRLIPRKGHMLVLNQCQRLVNEIPGFKLVIIGDGLLKSEFEKFVSEHDLNSVVRFTGNVPNVRPVLNEADLVLVPSYAEGLPLVIFEAMSVSKPVLAFDTIGPAEAILEGETGFKIAAFDSELFASKIIELAKKPEYLKQLGAAGKKWVESEFSLSKMTERTRQFYQTSLKSRPFLTT